MQLELAPYYLYLFVIHQSKNCRNLNMDVYENREAQFDPLEEKTWTSLPIGREGVSLLRYTPT